MDCDININQSQQLSITTHMIQGLQILNMGNIDLENRIKQEAEKNPVVEIEFKNNEVSIEEYFKNIDKNTYKDELLYDGDDVNLENIIKSKLNLYDYLKAQIGYYNLNKEERLVCNYIIDSLDEDGYIDNADKNLIKNHLNIDDELYDTCIGYVQSLEPIGVGASTLEECLSLQLKYLKINNKILNKIIKFDLIKIAKKDITGICKKYKITRSQCIEYINTIKKLEPKPGRVYQTEDVQYIRPDVVVKKVGDEYIAIINDSDNFNIYISQIYKDILNKEDSSKEAKKFIKQQISCAIDLIKNIENRKSTILKIANSIIKKQNNFFEKGLNYIRPMNMNEIAEDLNLNQSTISRGVNDKYMLTPYGIFEFKYFFSGGSEANSINDISSNSIKKIIKVKIDMENKKNPLSDEQIRIILEKEGIYIARRTVSKYRESLGILPSSKRKQI